MNQLHCWIAALGLLCCITDCTAVTINSFEGQNVILPCKYDSHYHGVCDICWMRGDIPTNGCGAQIIYANEHKKVMGNSARYQLNGALQKGDASLTILNARISDSGKYGCRVHVPGWFNDKKIVVYLQIIKATQQTTTLRNVPTQTHIHTHTPAPTTRHETTTVSEYVTTKHSETQHSTAQHSTLGYLTTTTLITTQGPDLTTQEEATIIPEYVTTRHTESQPTSDSKEFKTALTLGPALTTHIETTTMHVTSQYAETQQSSSTQGYVTPTAHTVPYEYSFGSSISETIEPVIEDKYALPAILVPVVLILLVLGILTIYLMFKHKRRFRVTLELNKKSSTSVSYSNLDSSVILPVNSSKN